MFNNRVHLLVKRILMCSWYLFMLVDLNRHQRIVYCGYEQRLPWCWTEEAAAWISQQLVLLVFHIAGMVLCIALCWCWQCLLTEGGNLLPHTVTTLDVTTVVWCCRQTKDVPHPAECPPAALQHQSDSGQHVSSLTDIALEVVVVCLLQISAFSSVWPCGLAVGQV